MAKGFVCPKCQSVTIGVIQTMPGENSIHRRRKCYNCLHLFHTYEIVSDIVPADPAFDFLFRKAPAQ